jgi:hypothetical protein
MGSSALGVMLAGFVEAQLAIDGQTDVLGVLVFLAVVLPPADRAQLQSAGRFEGFISTTGTAIACFDGRTHREWTEKRGRGLRGQG